MNKPKFRITLLDKKGLPISDRLVDQYTELLNGPSKPHKGGIKLEITLHDKTQLEKFKEYLDKLSGNLALPSKSHKRESAKVMEPEPTGELLNEALKAGKDQEKLITFLRKHDFKLLSTDYVKDTKLFKIKPKHEYYQWMVRRLFRAKDPQNDRYDPQLAFGIKILGKRKLRVRIYLYNKSYAYHDIPWPKKSNINWKKLNLQKFPQFMTIDERKKWRNEDRKLKANPDLKPTKFYTRFKEPIAAENKTSD